MCQCVCVKGTQCVQGVCVCVYVWQQCVQKTDGCVNSSDFLSTSQLEAFDLIKAFVRTCVSVCVRAEDNETHRRRSKIVKTALVRMWIHYCVRLSRTHPSLPQHDSSVPCTVKVWVCVWVCVCASRLQTRCCLLGETRLSGTKRWTPPGKEKDRETETEYHNISNKLSLEAGTTGRHFQGKVSRR